MCTLYGQLEMPDFIDKTGTAGGHKAAGGAPGSKGVHKEICSR